MYAILEHFGKNLSWNLCTHILHKQEIGIPCCQPNFLPFSTGFSAPTGESPVDLCRSLLHIQKKNCNTPPNYQITVQWMFVWSLKAQISQKSCALYHCKFECRLMEYLVREEDFYFIRIVRNGLMTWKRSLCVLCTISNTDWYVAGAKLFSNLRENLLSIY